MSQATVHQEFAQQAGAALGDAAREYESAWKNAALFDLSARGKIALTGAEAVPFLHNLCSNDIKNLPVGGGCEAFLTTAKARLVAPLCVSKLSAGGGKNLLLDYPRPASGRRLVRQHLGRYRISRGCGDRRSNGNDFCPAAFSAGQQRARCWDKSLENRRR